MTILPLRPEEYAAFEEALGVYEEYVARGQFPAAGAFGDVLLRDAGGREPTDGHETRGQRARGAVG